MRIACTHTMRGRVDIPYVRTIGPYSTHVRTYIQYVHHSGLCVPIHTYMHVYVRTCVGIRICTCPHTYTRPHSIIYPNCKYVSALKIMFHCMHWHVVLCSKCSKFRHAYAVGHAYVLTCGWTCHLCVLRWHTAVSTGAVLCAVVFVQS